MHISFEQLAPGTLDLELEKNSISTSLLPIFPKIYLFALRDTS